MNKSEMVRLDKNTARWLKENKRAYEELEGQKISLPKFSALLFENNQLFPPFLPMERFARGKSKSSR